MWDIIQKIRRLFSPEDKKKFIGVVVIQTISAFSELLGIGLLIVVIGVFLNQEKALNNYYMKEYFDFLKLSWNNFVAINIIFVAIILILRNIFLLFATYWQSKFIYSRQKNLSERMFNRYLNATYSFMQEHPYAECYSNVTRAMQLCPRVLLPLMQVLTDFIMIAFLGIAMVAIFPYIALSSIVFMLFSGFVIYYITRSFNTRKGREMDLALLEINKVQHIGFVGIKSVKAFCKEKFFSKIFSQRQKEYNNCYMWLYIAGQFPRIMLEISAMLLMLAVFTVMLLLNVPLDEILLTFTAIVAIMARILPALSRCNYNIAVIKQNQFLFDVVSSELLNAIPENIGNENIPITLSKNLEIKDLSFSYDGKNDIIRNFNISLEANKSLGIAGKTGCGKTTIIDLVLGFLQPTKGGIFSDGKNINENVKLWRSMIGYVPQNIYIIEGSIKENVAFGIPPKDVDEKRVVEVLKIAQIYDWVSNKSENINYLLADNGANISGGQRQRIGIARALYHNPKLLILDEATSALDNETEEAFVDALENLNGKFTMIIVAHRLSTIEKCDYLIKL